MSSHTTASALIQQADAAGENLARTTLDQVFAPTDINVPTTPQQFLQESTRLAGEAFQASGIEESFARIRTTGRRAAAALDINASNLLDKELSRVPLDAMQDEVDRLISRRFRILPDILSDPTIIDFRSKRRIASKIEGLFDREIDKVLDKKNELERAAEKRARSTVDAMKAQASILNQQLQTDKFELGKRIDLFQSGQGSIQDILEQAVQMSENRAKASSKENRENMFVGAYSDDEIRLFKSYEAAVIAGGSPLTVPLNSTASGQEKQEFIARIAEWNDDGRPGEFKIVEETLTFSPGEFEVLLGELPDELDILRKKKIGAIFAELTAQQEATGFNFIFGPQGFAPLQPQFPSPLPSPPPPTSSSPSQVGLFDR